MKVLLSWYAKFHRMIFHTCMSIKKFYMLEFESCSFFSLSNKCVNLFEKVEIESTKKNYEMLWIKITMLIICLCDKCFHCHYKDGNVLQLFLITMSHLKTMFETSAEFLQALDYRRSFLGTRCIMTFVTDSWTIAIHVSKVLILTTLIAVLPFWDFPIPKPTNTEISQKL